MKWEKPRFLEMEALYQLFFMLMRNGKTDEAIRLNVWMCYFEGANMQALIDSMGSKKPN